MNIEELKTEAQSLSIDERCKLMAFIVGLEDDRSAVKNQSHVAVAKKEEDYFPVRKIVGRRHL